ncbi:MAG: hypothetical protein ACHRHE_03185 [Tepidisphaerales bacterium]
MPDGLHLVAEDFLQRRVVAKGGLISQLCERLSLIEQGLCLLRAIGRRRTIRVTAAPGSMSVDPMAVDRIEDRLILRHSCRSQRQQQDEESRQSFALLRSIREASVIPESNAVARNVAEE